MGYKRFIGVDVSKETIDCCGHGLNCFRQFGNHPKGYDQLFSWMQHQLDCDLYSEALICFEHTGMYSLALACYLDDQELIYNMIPPLELKRSTGIHRGKSDMEDAKMIARYAHVHRDTIQPNQLPSRRCLSYVLCLLCGTDWLHSKLATRLHRWNRSGCPDSKHWKYWIFMQM